MSFFTCRMYGHTPMDDGICMNCNVDVWAQIRRTQIRRRLKLPRKNSHEKTS